MKAKTSTANKRAGPPIVEL